MCCGQFEHHCSVDDPSMTDITVKLFLIVSGWTDLLILHGAGDIMFTKARKGDPQIRDQLGRSPRPTKTHFLRLISAL